MYSYLLEPTLELELLVLKLESKEFEAAVGVLFVYLSLQLILFDSLEV